MTGGHPCSKMSCQTVLITYMVVLVSFLADDLRIVAVVQPCEANTHPIVGHASFWSQSQKEHI